MRSWTAFSRFVCLSRAAGQGDFQKLLPISTIIWFSDTRYRELPLPLSWQSLWHFCLEAGSGRKGSASNGRRSDQRFLEKPWPKPVHGIWNKGCYKMADVIVRMFFITFESHFGEDPWQMEKGKHCSYLPKRVTGPFVELQVSQAHFHPLENHRGKSSWNMFLVTEEKWWLWVSINCSWSSQRSFLDETTRSVNEQGITLTLANILWL